MSLESDTIDAYLEVVSKTSGPRTTVQQLQAIRLLIASPLGLTAAELAKTLNISHQAARRHMTHWIQVGGAIVLSNEDDARETRYHYVHDTKESRIFSDLHRLWSNRIDSTKKKHRRDPIEKVN